MRPIIATIIFISLIFVVNSDDKLSYLTYLLKQKQLVQSKVAQISSINHNLLINLKMNNQANFQQKWLASAIRDQHSLAIGALSFTFISLSQKTSNCTENKQFGSKITDIQAQLDKNRQIIADQPACLRNDFIKANFKFYQTVCQGFKKEAISNCSSKARAASIATNIPFLDTGSTKNVPNTKTDMPWVYGSITAKQYQAKSNQLITLYGAGNCLSNLPFLDENNNCISCPDATVYDISLKKCKKCDAGTAYASSLHECSKFTISFNSKLEGNDNYIGSVPTTNSLVGLCPIDKPYFDGKSCISCSLPMYFSFLSNSCEACKNDSVFDTISKSCITISFFMSNLTGIENFIGSPLSPLPYDSIKNCPAQAPFSNGKQCFSCKLPQFYNFQRMNCQSCPNQSNFDIKTHSCISTNTAIAFSNSNLMGNRNFVGKIPLYNNLFQSCQENTPFFNGKQCISCQQPSYFDFDTLTCSNCMNGLSFNIIIQTCEYINQDYYTETNAKNIYYNGNFDQITSQINQRKNKNSNLKVCSGNTPFYNTRTNVCIGCQASLPLFDLKNNKCMVCPSGSDFDESSHICLTKHVPATLQRMIMNTV